MTPDLIIQFIASLTGTGGLIALFLITEKKTAAQLENTRKIDEKWQSIIARQEKDLELLGSRYEAATAKIGKLYDDNSDLRNRLDRLGTDCAVSSLMRCDCVACPSRKPPFGTHNPTDTEELEHDHENEKEHYHEQEHSR